MVKKILFISHKADRSGAPILLLNLITLLKERTTIKLEVIIKEDGVLTNEFKRLVKTKVYSKGHSFFQKIRRVVFRVVTKLFLHKYDLIVSNTIINANIDYLLNKHNNVYTYVHELPYVIDAMTKKEEVEKVIEHSKMFLVPSSAVKQNLKKTYSIDESKIKHLPYYVPDYIDEKARHRKKFRTKYALDEASFIVGGMGAIEWRKGVDLFLEVAQLAALQKTSIYFVWCGGKEASDEWRQMATEIEELQLQKNFLLLPENGFPAEVMAAFDLFFLSSREDPYPMVMIEAAMMNLPFVYFTGTGGADEFIGTECGFGAKAFEIEEVCRFIFTLLNKENVRKSLADHSRSNYLQMHTKEPVYKAFRQILESSGDDKSDKIIK